MVVRSRASVVGSTEVVVGRVADFVDSADQLAEVVAEAMAVVGVVVCSRV